MCLTLCYTQWKLSDEEKTAREFIRKTASPRDGPILASHLLLIASLSLSLFIRRSVSLFSVSLLLRVVLSSPRVLSFIMMRCSLRRLYIFALR